MPEQQQQQLLQCVGGDVGFRNHAWETHVVQRKALHARNMMPEQQQQQLV
jgi:hypothetical protein